MQAAAGLVSILLICCAGKKSSEVPEKPPPGEPPETVFDDPVNYFVVFVDQGGSIFVDDIPLQEEEMIDSARERLAANPDVKALLFVSSSQIQGIHLTARLSEIGYKNVAVYYPTASPQKPEKK